MEFGDDDDIQSLLDMGEYVIDSIKHAQVAGNGTAGRSAIPRGIVKSTTEAWEQDSALQEQNPTIGMDNQQDTHPEQDIPRGGPEDPSEPHLSGSDQTNKQRAALSGLFSSLDMLEQKQIKKGGGGGIAGSKSDSNQRLTSTHQLHSSNIQTTPKIIRSQEEKSNPSMTVTPMIDRPSQVNLGSQMQDLAQYGNLGIGGSTHLDGTRPKTPSSLHHGATQLVHPYELSQQSRDAGVEIAPVTAQDVNLIMTTLMQQQTALQSLTQSLNKITESLALLPMLRNDLQVVKSSCALLEAQLASIRILDPGHASVSSLNELKSTGQQAIVVTHGNINTKDSQIYQQPIVLDELARPVAKEFAINNQPARTVDVADIEAVKAIITTYVRDDKKASRYINQLAKVSTMDQLLRLKQQILNS